MLDGVHILGVHHDPGRNGATLLFQTVLEGLANSHGARISMSFPRDGPIVARAQALGPVQLPEARPARRALRARVAYRRRQRLAERSRAGYDLVFANSAASLPDVEWILDTDRTPLAVYVHESGYLLRHVVDLAAATRLLRRADLIFAVSPQVGATLEELIHPTAPIVPAPGFVPVHPAPDRRVLPPVVDAASRAGAMIVGGLGTMSWYKGTDLFVVVARRVRELLPDHDVKFIWVGDEWREETRPQLKHDVRMAELEDIVLLPGGMEDPAGFLQSLALLLLPSREDSWPLAVLEAAAAGVPVVCFRGSGGAEDLVASGGGTAVPYLDVEAMARAAAGYIADPQLRARDSRAARQLARSDDAADRIGAIAAELAALCASRSTP
jgi:glycosyltransferase involved in cell wall biosynthesis